MLFGVPVGIEQDMPVSEESRAAQAKITRRPAQHACLELEVTQDAPQKNIARAGNVRMPTTTFVLSNLACTLHRGRFCPTFRVGTPA